MSDSAIPVPATSFIGREAEVADLLDLLDQPAAARCGRLVTLTGIGGTGKTRLAQQVAERLGPRLKDGAHFVALSTVSDPELVPSTIAGVLGVREQGSRPVREALAAYLESREMLLVLDNFEHVLESAELVAELLAAAAGLRVLATSRERLRLRGEQLFAVPPMGLPVGGEGADFDAVMRAPAVALFVERAQAVEPGFVLEQGNAAAVAAVCARLDGLPLAIELAAARIKTRTPAALLEDLSDRLRALTGGRRHLDARQQTIRGMIDWSYTLLGPGEQALFARLSVFAGGWTAEEAAAVCPIDDDLPFSVEEGLASLVEKSLVQEPSTDGRFSMLETVQAYAIHALERLSAQGDSPKVAAQHTALFRALAEQAAPELLGPAQRAWLERLEIEHANLRAALTRCLHGAMGPEAGPRFAAALAPFWEARGYLSEGCRWLEQVMATGTDENGAPLVLWPRLCRWRARFLELLGDFAAAMAWIQRLEDSPGAEGSTDLAVGLANASLIAQRSGNPVAARARIDRAVTLARAVGTPMIQADVLNISGILAYEQDAYEQAVALLKEALALFEITGHAQGQAKVQSNLANCYESIGLLDQARLHGEQAYATLELLGDDHRRGNVALNLGLYAQKQGALEQALGYFEEAVRLYEWTGASPYSLAMAHVNLAFVLTRQGDIEAAQLHLGPCAELIARSGSQDIVPILHFARAQIALKEGQHAEAEREAQDGLAVARAIGARMEEGALLRVLGGALAARDPEQAEASLVESMRILREIGDRYEEASSRLDLARYYAGAGRWATAQEAAQGAGVIFEELQAALDLDETRAVQAQIAEAQAGRRSS